MAPEILIKKTFLIWCLWTISFFHISPSVLSRILIFVRKDILYKLIIINNVAVYHSSDIFITKIKSDCPLISVIYQKKEQNKLILCFYHQGNTLFV